MDIFKTNGTKLTSIADGTIDNTSSPLSLPARNVSGYGKVLNENLVKLLENFADVTPPANSITGQLWYDTEDSGLYVNTTRGYRPLSIAYKTSSTPENSKSGEFWWDSGKKQLKLFDGTNWTVVGPGYESSWGKSGAFAETVRDTQGIDHLVVNIKFNDQENIIVSKDVEFVPENQISGFGSIKPGINVNSQVTGFLYNSTADNSNKLDNIQASTYLRKDQDSFIDGQLSVEEFGLGRDLLAKIAIVGSTEKDLVISNEINESSIKFDLFVENVKATVLELDHNGQILLYANPTTPLSAATKGYVDVVAEENKNYIDNKFNDNGSLPIARGGTGANTIEAAREALRVPGINGTGAIGQWNIDISGLAQVSNLSRNSESLNGFIESTGPLTDTIARRDSSGDLRAVEFIGVATSARYADLAEKYLPDADYDVGTVVMIGGNYEITACVTGSRAIGAVSKNPAYMMNSELEGGIYVALKGRVPVKIIGAVKKGDLLAAANDGKAKVSAENNNVFAIALESNDEIGEKIVECVIL